MCPAIALDSECLKMEIIKTLSILHVCMTADLDQIQSIGQSKGDAIFFTNYNKNCYSLPSALILSPGAITTLRTYTSQALFLNFVHKNEQNETLILLQKCTVADGDAIYCTMINEWNLERTGNFPLFVERDRAVTLSFGWPS
jgi:hypothetical protein